VWTREIAKSRNGSKARTVFLISPFHNFLISAFRIKEEKVTMVRSDSRCPVLIVDDEEIILFTSSLILKSEGFENVITLKDGREVMPLLKNQEVSAILLDLYMPDIFGLDLLKEITYEYPEIPVLVTTAANDIETAVECMKSGAFDYLLKPIHKNRLVASIKKAFEVKALEGEVSSLKQSLLNGQLQNETAFSGIITTSKKMQAIFRYAEAVAGTGQPILITGETGVGKELIARAVHKIGRPSATFVPVNVAGLDDVVFSDTLFGHRKGAFTGADQNRDGLIRQASSGTLFLDEIGDLCERSQVKLLRLIQEKEYYQLGSDVCMKTDARIVVATNQALRDRMADNSFRKDLYYRLKTHQICIPPLRERLEDIPFLLDHFLKEATDATGKRLPSYPAELVVLLQTYDFPGNIRELQAMVWDALARHTNGVLSMESFKQAIGGGKEQHAKQESDSIVPSVFAGLKGFPTLKQIEGLLISEALKMANNNQGIAASLLGVSRQALNKRLVRKAEITL
jgi:DNA-binding NtrC family response regulator